MKKLFLLVALPLLIFACGDSDTPEPAPEYLPNSTIHGKWYNINGLDSTVMIFEGTIWKDEIWDKYTQRLKNSGVVGQNYKLTNNKIILSDITSYSYKLEGDILTIFESADGSGGTLWIPYIKIKEIEED